MSDSVESWLSAYVAATDWGHKYAPPPCPRVWAPPSAAPVAAPDAPGRPPELWTRPRTKTPRRASLHIPRKRAHLFHILMHHELQAAELMAWAILRFRAAPSSFRRGLLKIMHDELRHLRMYADHISALGFAVGDFPVNDWFWRRVPQVETPVAFVSLMGMGLEGRNLDHVKEYHQALLDAGDAVAAEIHAQVGREEVPHVAFGIRWFRRFTAAPEDGPLVFRRWADALVPPLSPRMMQGATINRAARIQAGFDDAFLEDLASWHAPSPGTST